MVIPKVGHVYKLSLWRREPHLIVIIDVNKEDMEYTYMCLQERFWEDTISYDEEDRDRYYYLIQETTIYNTPAGRELLKLQYPHIKEYL